MTAYLDNTVHKYNNKAMEQLCLKSGMSASSYNYKDFKFAQDILKNGNPSVSNEELRNISNLLLNSIMRSNATDGRFVDNASQTVILWDRQLPVGNSSIASVRSFFKMKFLRNWQRDLFNRLIIIEQTEKVYFFQKNALDFVWVIANNPSTKLIFKYSQLYVDVSAAYNIDADFIVYGRNELPKSVVPEDAIIMERGE